MYFCGVHFKFSFFISVFIDLTLSLVFLMSLTKIYQFINCLYFQRTRFYFYRFFFNFLIYFIYFCSLSFLGLWAMIKCISALIFMISFFLTLGLFVLSLVTLGILIFLFFL